MKIFTIESGTVTPGAVVSDYTLKGCDATIKVVSVGETGRGRRRDFIMVAPNIIIPGKDEYALPRIERASIGKTRAGKAKLVRENSPETDKVLVVLLTSIGFRGGNGHTGDYSGWSCCDCKETGEDFPPPGKCPKCGEERMWLNGPQPEFEKFPGEILLKPWVACRLLPLKFLGFFPLST